MKRPIIPPPLRFLRLKEVMRRTGLSRSSIYLLIKNGQFPRQIQLGPRAIGWTESEVNNWIASKIAERDREAETHDT